MVTDLWAFVCPFGYNGEIELWPIKSRNENAVTLFYVCLVVFNWGVYRSDMGPLSPVVSKPYAYSDENPLISTENVNCYCDLDRGQTDLGEVCWVGLQQMYLKIFQTQRWQFVPPSKVSTVKTFCGPGDLKNKVKVKLMTRNKRSCHCASEVWISNLPYSNGYWFMDICLSHWL